MQESSKHVSPAEAPDAGEPGHPDSAEHPAGEHSARRKKVMLGLKLFAGMVVIAAPVYVAGLFVPGLFGVAFFGVLAATFGWISGGPKIGAAVAFSLSVLGISAILLKDATWALALILILLGVVYGYASSRGIGKAVVQLPILTPYFMMAPLALYSDPPTIDAAYVLGIFLIMNLTGAWAILVLHLALGHKELKPVTVIDRRVPLLGGAVLGIVSALVMWIGTATELKSHWVWITLTLYLLTDLTQPLIDRRLLGRVLGTTAGIAVVAALVLLKVPEGVLSIIGVFSLWLCLFLLVQKQPYWRYSVFLTISVVLMNSKGMSTLLLDAERFGFTLVGALISAGVTLLVGRVLHRPPLRVGEPHARAGSLELPG